MLKFNHHHISVFHITIFQAAAINSFPFSPWRKNLYYLSFSSLLVLILLNLINLKGLAKIKLKI